MFENVTYEFYTQSLKRDVIGDEKTFEKYALLNKVYVKTLLLDGMLIEKEEGAVDRAVCMMAEIDYLTALACGKEKLSDDSPVASENIGGYSYSLDSAVKSKALELNAKSAEKEKYKYLKLYCDFDLAIR